MLYFIEAGGREKTWHTGSSKPECVKVVEVQADGGELEYIKRAFTNLPCSIKAVVQWKGELAQFIYDNL
jgi:hypothetical protein